MFIQVKRRNSRTGQFEGSYPSLTREEYSSFKSLEQACGYASHRGGCPSPTVGERVELYSREGVFLYGGLLTPERKFKVFF